MAIIKRKASNTTRTLLFQWPAKTMESLIRILLYTVIAGQILPASAAEVNLRWDPVNDPQVAAYEVHYGAASGSYDEEIAAVSDTVTAPDLQPGDTYFFAVRACASDGVNCSEFSNEVTATIPDPGPITPDPPTADFTASQTTGYAPLTVTFSDTSSGDISERSWDFGDGGGSSSAATQAVYAYTSPGTYSVALSVTGPDGNDTETKSNFIEVLARDPVDNPVAIEAGEVAITHQWKRVNFRDSFTDPIVVAKSLSHNEGDPAVVRIDGVDAAGFWVRIWEWEYLDGTHIEESVGYLVTERGRHQLDDGTWIEADRLDISATNAFEYAAFEGTFVTAPVVVAAITSVGEDDAVTTRVQNIDVDGFEVGLREQEANLQLHAKESVDYIAWPLSSGLVDGLRYEVGRTGNEVTEVPFYIGFQETFDTPPVFVADIQTVDGGNTANLRWQDKIDVGVDVWIDEEQSRDSETDHPTEIVGYFAFEGTGGETTPSAPAEVILDNQDANTTYTGNWGPSSGADPWAGESLYNNGGETFRWAPQLGTGATYEVYAWWTYHGNRSNNVVYRVSHADGTDTVIVDQHDTALGGQWNLLGTFSFDAGSGYIEVSSENGQASADAVRLVRVETPAKPGTQPSLEVIVDNQDANITYTGNWRPSSGADPWAGESLYNNGGETFGWLPQLETGGTYEVYACWTYYRNRSSNVVYRVSHAGGTDTVIVDQHDSALGGQWNLLGTYSFDAGSGYVEVSSENGQASADAVRLILVD